MTQNVRARFAAYAVVLALALAGGAAAGAAVGPIDTGDDPEHPAHPTAGEPTPSIEDDPVAPTTTVHAGHTGSDGEG